MARRSWENRRRNKASRQATVTANQSAQPSISASQPIQPVADSQADQVKAIELTRVRSRLDTLDRLMQAAKTDRQWDNLSRAYERVFKAWVHLAGIPGPGNRKPGPDRKRDKPTGQTATVTIAPAPPPPPPVNPG